MAMEGLFIEAEIVPPAALDLTASSSISEQGQAFPSAAYSSPLRNKGPLYLASSLARRSPEAN